MQTYDVVICGGGLAGLTLARYLRRQLPAASVAVVEPTRRPLPDACHKVGESSVEIGAQFFEERCALSEYLHSRHLVKNGLRYFSGDTQGPLAARREIGPSETPVINSFQLDRGRLETDLRAIIEEDGVTLLEGHSVFDIELAPGATGEPHVVQIASAGARTSIGARWVVDASGRRRLLSRKLGLGAESHHDHSSAWFRVKGHFDVGSLVPQEEQAWHARDVDHSRWLSTCHLMGKGYWVWLIPLGSGFHSIGIVAAEEHHPFATYARPETAMAWLAEHEPVLHAAIEHMPLEDFKFLRSYAYSATRVFSEDRWACVGEAGAFVDPLYSPGSDFIGLMCSMTTELIRADLSGEPHAALRARREELESFFLGFLEVTFETFRGHSHINGAPGVLASKLYWDSTHYWSFVCPYFFNEIYRLPPAEHARFRALHREFAALNVRAQFLLKTWARLEEAGAPRAWGDFVPLPPFPSALADLHLDLANRRSADETYEVMCGHLARAKEVVSELALRALRALGPARAPELARITGLASWGLSFEPARLEWDESEARGVARKNLSRIARDMDRALGRPEQLAPDPSAPAPTMRALLSLVGLEGGVDGGVGGGVEGAPV